MMTSTEEQNLAIARIFIEQFLSKGDMAGSKLVCGC
jgi:hypothetical protein